MTQSPGRPRLITFLMISVVITSLGLAEPIRANQGLSATSAKAFSSAKPGQRCPKAGQVRRVGTTTFKCVRSRGRLIWQKVKVTAPTMITQPTVSSTPATTSTTPATTTPAAPAATTTIPATTTTTTIPGSFSSGTKAVGASGIAPGRYMTTSASSCYWERLRGFSGTIDDILANDNSPGRHVVVDIKASDVGFSSSRCGVWYPYKPAPPSTVGDGIWVVRDEMQPGLWSATFTTSCYWARLSGFSGDLDDIVANANPTGSAIVRIETSDVGFISTRCGTWSKIG